MSVVYHPSFSYFQIEATRRAFSRTFPSCDVVIISVSVPSGVPDQPMGDDETRQGALNRACNARSHLCDQGESADFFVGLEGGCVFEARVELPSTRGAQGGTQQLSCFAWGIVIKTDSSVVGAARTASFQLPAAVADLVSQVCCRLLHHTAASCRLTGNGTRCC